MYTVLMSFIDGENGKAFASDKGGVGYKVGDGYPVKGFHPTEAHIAYLLGSKNGFGKPVIAEKNAEPEKKKPEPKKPKKKAEV